MRTQLFAIIITCATAISACNSSEDSTTTVTAPTSDSTTIDSLEWLNKQLVENPNDADLYFKRAEYRMSNGLPSEASADIDRALLLDSNQADYYLLKAGIEFNKKEYQASKDWLLKGKKNVPDAVDIRMKLVDLYMLVENYEKAFDEINGVLEIDPFYAQAYFAKGLVYKFMEDYKNAVSSFHTAVEQDNDYYQAWMQLGVMYGSVQDERAIDYYNNALRIDSTREEGWYNRAYLYQQLGDYENALSDYDGLLRQNPSYYNAHYNKGYIYLEYLNDYPQALIEFNAVLGINPMNYQALYNRGLTYERMGNYSEAATDYKQVLTMKPDHDLAAQGMSRLNE